MCVFENDMQSDIYISYKKVTKGVIRSRNSKQDKQYNVQNNKKDKRTNKNLQSTTHKTKDRLHINM